MLSSVLHVLLLLCLGVGFGFWFWRITGARSPLRGWWWLWCALVGFAAQALLIEQAYCAGVSFRIASWAVLGIALAGVAAFVFAARKAAPLLRRRMRRQIAAVATVAAIVGVAQGASWLTRGPEHFFGRARIDQLNYVMLAQYLIDGPRGTTIQELGLRPWLARAIDTAEGRITQSIPQAELAVMAGSDTQRTFGAIDTAYVVLAAIAVQGLLGAWGVRRRWAMLAGIAAALLPAMTVTHLEGFLSQTAVMWVLPAIAGILCRHRPGLPAAIGAGVLVGFFVGAYTEYAVLPAVAGVAAVRWGSGWRPWLRTAGIVGVSAGLALLLSLPRLAEYAVSQFGKARDPDALSYLVPGSGTFAGWGREFVGEVPAWITFVGILVTLATVAAIALAPRAWRSRAAVLFAGPLLLATPMVLAEHLPLYPFGKLLRIATPLVVVAIALLALGRGGRWRSFAAFGLLAGFVGAGAVALVAAQREVIAGTPAIADADLAIVRTHPVFEGAPRLPPSNVLLDGDRPLTTGWLAYHARRHPVYLLRQDVTDRVLPEEYSECRRWPEGLRDVFVVRRDAVTREAFVPPPPRLSAENGELLNVGPGRVWRAKGTLWLRLDRSPAADGNEPENRWVCFALRCAKPGAVFAARSPGRATVSRFPAGERWAFRASWREPAMRFSIQGPDAETEFFVVAIGVEPYGAVNPEYPPMGFFGVDLDAKPAP